MSLFRDLYQNPNDDHTINLMMIDNRFVKSKSELSLLLFFSLLIIIIIENAETISAFVQVQSTKEEKQLESR